MIAARDVIPFRAEAHPIRFVRSRAFARDAARIFTEEEFSGFLNWIAANPDSGDKIPGGSGLRKIRWRAKGSGKRGGARIIYFFRDLNMPLLLLAVYAKNEQARLSKDEIKAVQRKMQVIILRLTADCQMDRGPPDQSA